MHWLGELAVPGLVGPRGVRVYVPPGTDEVRRRPVLYLWDGQNVFEDEGSYAGGWRVHELMERRQRNRRKVAIVVGVHHGGEHRIAELAPFRTARYGEGRAPALLAWVAGHLKPLVDRSFPTLPGPADTLVGGSSMGGLMSLYALVERPDVFGRALVMSPALWYAQGRILPWAARRGLAPGARLYIDAGAHEGGLVELGWKLVRQLDERQVYWRVDRRGRHRESDWRRRLPNALQYLLGPKAR